MDITDRFQDSKLAQYNGSGFSHYFININAKVQQSAPILQLLLVLSRRPLAVEEVGDIPITIGVLIVVIADVINEQRDGRVCGDHSADDGAAVLWLYLEGQRSFVHKDAVGGAGDECGVNVPRPAVGRHSRRRVHGEDHGAGFGGGIVLGGVHRSIGVVQPGGGLACMLQITRN